VSQWFQRPDRRRMTALAAALFVAAPVAVLPVRAQFGGRQNSAPRQGMSTRKKVVLLAGAALLYYLYKKHQSRQTQQNAAGQSGGPGMGTRQASNRKPQLYRSKNGGVYYRDARGRPVWLTVPSRGMQVPAEDVTRYAPDYARYRGPAPSAPAGYRAQSFSQFDPSLTGGGGGYGGAGNGYGGGRGGGGMMGGPPGPGGR